LNGLDESRDIRHPALLVSFSLRFEPYWVVCHPSKELVGPSASCSLRCEPPFGITCVVSPLGILGWILARQIFRPGLVPTPASVVTLGTSPVVTSLWYRKSTGAGACGRRPSSGTVLRGVACSFRISDSSFLGVHHLNFWGSIVGWLFTLCTCY
jgi:hypothetical protein